MKKKTCLICSVAACFLLLKCFPVFWKNCISLPILRALSFAGKSAPFSILEWSVLILAAGLACSFFRCMMQQNFRIALRTASRRILCLLIAACALFAALWLPLYEKHTIPSASPEQLKACAEAFIREFNQNLPDFSCVPNDLPAKSAAFPAWLRRMNISGFYSFLTGEALLSPDLAPAALPFVAVHESIHGRGVADEGFCNILAYEECIARGGSYAASAKLWALHYLLGELRRADAAAYAACIGQMQPPAINLLDKTIGVHEKNAANSLQAVFASFTGSSGYEILAHHLAVKMAG